MALVDLILGFVRAFVFVYDVFSFPVYKMLEKQWEEKTRQKLGQVVNTSKDANLVAFRRQKGNSDIYEEIIVRNKVGRIF